MSSNNLYSIAEFHAAATPAKTVSAMLVANACGSTEPLKVDNQINRYQMVNVGLSNGTGSTVYSHV